MVNDVFIHFTIDYRIVGRTDKFVILFRQYYGQCIENNY